MATSDFPLPPSATHPSSTFPEPDGEQDSSGSSSDTGTPPLTRSDSCASTRSSSSHNESEEWEFYPPMDRLTIFDYLDQLALPQRLEKLNRTVLVQRDNLKKQRDSLKRQYEEQKQKVMRRTEFEKYKRKYQKGLDRLFEKWNDTRVVSMKEKVAFVVGVSNIFVTGFLIGGHPDWVHIWYSIQLVYFMPIRFYTYHKRGYHYFLADLCYFVNLLLVLAIWVFPNSRRLLIASFCLSNGNNAWAIAMWRNSMVFHSLDKVTSLFIHIMPPLVLHCLIHLCDPAYIAARFPAIDKIKNVEHYGLSEMVVWATVPYAIWQLSYHFLITVRRKDKIAAGRPTSFTWLRKSYSKTWIGKLVLSLPEVLQEPAFMMIQYLYAVATMLPCTLWFYNKTLSSIFLSAVGLLSTYNGATYYIDVFGKRFQNELESLKKEVEKWQREAMDASPVTPGLDDGKKLGETTGASGVSIPDGRDMKERNVTTGSLPLNSQ